MTSPYLLQPCTSKRDIARKCADEALRHEIEADACTDPEEAEKHRRMAHQYAVTALRLDSGCPVALRDNRRMQ